MIIRKISIGPDYKGGAMHYVHGQLVANGQYKICEISAIGQEILIWVSNEKGEIMRWKLFNANMPIAIEYNLEF